MMKPVEENKLLFPQDDESSVAKLQDLGPSKQESPQRSRHIMIIPAGNTSSHSLFRDTHLYTYIYGPLSHIHKTVTSQLHTCIRVELFSLTMACIFKANTISFIFRIKICTKYVSPKNFD